MQMILSEQFPQWIVRVAHHLMRQVQSLASDAYKALFVCLSESQSPVSWEFPSAQIYLIFILLMELINTWKIFYSI